MKKVILMGMLALTSIVMSCTKHEDSPNGSIDQVAGTYTVDNVKLNGVNYGNGYIPELDETPTDMIVLFIEPDRVSINTVDYEEWVDFDLVEKKNGNVYIFRSVNNAVATFTLGKDKNTLFLKARDDEYILEINYHRNN